MHFSQEAYLKQPALAHWSDESPAVAHFDFPGWQTAEPIHLRRYWSGAKAPASRHAEVRVLWSQKALHLLFDCNQQEPLVVEANPQTSEKAVGLWDRDVCEFFVAPHAEMANYYYEFEAAPTGEWLDIAIECKEGERKSNWEFRSGLRVATRFEELRILISMHIPWSKQIPKPNRGAKWRANFFRCIGSGNGRGYLAWQPTLTEEPNFHVPEAFGWLQFVDFAKTGQGGD